jgi:hypothetical protein
VAKSLVRAAAVRGAAVAFACSPFHHGPLALREIDSVAAAGNTASEDIALV